MVYNYKGKKISLEDKLVKAYEPAVMDTVCDRTISQYIDVLELDNEKLKKISNEKLSEEITRMMKEDMEVIGGVSY